MGCCNSAPREEHDGALKPIQVRAAASTRSGKEQPVASVNTQPDAAAAPAHPFGLPLTSPELQALFPSHDPPPPLKPAEVELWSGRILPDPSAFKQAEAQTWNRCIIEQRIPQLHRVKLWTDVLGVNKTQTPCTYFEYLQQSSPADSQISRGIYRTFSDHPFFTHKPVQRCIGRILHAWSLFNPSVSYVQGHNCLAALFLMVPLDEERAWRCFLSFLADPELGMQHFYSDGLKLLVAQCAHLGLLVEASLPALAAHMSQQHLDPLMWATPFYLTAFTHHLPLEACVFVFDFVLLANLAECKAALPAVAASETPLSSSPIALAITHLTLALLREQQSALLRIPTMDRLFRTIQQLDVLAKQKTRQLVFERALA